MRNKEPIEPEEIFNDRWHCEHSDSACVEGVKPTCKTTGLPCCMCQPVCEHRSFEDCKYGIEKESGVEI